MNQHRFLHGVSASVLLALLPLVLTQSAAIAGYDLTISHSGVDPDVNTSAQSVGLDSLFLWVKCADEGLNALEAELSSDMTALISFTPHPGVVNLGTSTSLLLGVGSCPTGDSANVVLGSILVLDDVGGYVNLDPTAVGAIVAVSCDSTPFVYSYEARAVGFRSGGGSPDTTGAEYGCGSWPDQVVANPFRDIGGEWSDAFSEPPGGEGADSSIAFMMRRKNGVQEEEHDLIVTGRFTQLGGVAAPGVAVFEAADYSNDPIQGTWAPLPSPPPAVTSGTYLTADETSTHIALGGDTDPPFRHWDGTAWEGESPVLPAVDPDPVVHGIEHWSANDRFLLVGDWFDPDAINGPPFHFSGLAQWNPEWETDLEYFSPFGYPVIGTNTNYWLETGQYATAITEITAGPAAGSIVIGGYFDAVHGEEWTTQTDKTITTGNAAWLDPQGEFHAWAGANGLPGPTYDFEHRPTLPYPTHLYAAGSYGVVQGPLLGEEETPVWVLDLTSSPLGPWQRIPGGGGPMKHGVNNHPVVYDLFIFDGFLYAVGDFDRVWTTSEPGGEVEPAAGFARYSIAARVWESLGEDALNSVGHAGVRMKTAVVLGGDFTTVSNAVSSHHMAQYRPPGWEITGVDNSAVPARLAPIGFGVASPNPASNGVTFYVLLDRLSAVDLTLYDIAGRRVSNVHAHTKPMSAGAHMLRWDGDSHRGRPAAPGVYFAVLTVGEERHTRKVTVIR